jgi:hypothetical protein
MGLSDVYSDLLQLLESFSGFAFIGEASDESTEGKEVLFFSHFLQQFFFIFRKLDHTVDFFLFILPFILCLDTFTQIEKRPSGKSQNARI